MRGAELIPERAKELGIRMAIVAVPPDAAQMVVDALVGAGIRLLFNFAP